MEESNIIAIRKIDNVKANDAFTSLMKKTEDILNHKAKTNIQFYKSLSSSALEKVSLTEIKNACANTPFNPENVELVSGQNFPDIIAEKYFGVEVKSTKYNHWTSTGSSIIESTRDKNVQNIYMLFGKLGGEIAEFKCRPYQDVLSEITVTHSPRYLINMNLTSGETIFDKMGTTYDKLRTSEDSINQVRNYYRNKSNNNDQMPWWISDNDSESINMNLRLWATLPEDESILITAQMAVLFPEIMNPASKKEKYYRPALWLAACKGIVCHNFRDSFTAGGKVVRRNGSALKKPLPHVYYTLYRIFPHVKQLLNHYESIFDYISEYNSTILNSKDKLDGWISQMHNEMRPESYNIDLKNFIETTKSLELVK